jgi:hypothetical protein
MAGYTPDFIRNELYIAAELREKLGRDVRLSEVSAERVRRINLNRETYQAHCTVAQGERDKAGEVVMRYAQHVARKYTAWRGPIQNLAALLFENDCPGTLPEIEFALRREDIQRDLFVFRETGLWRASDRSMRLVAYVPQSSPEVARERLERRPERREQCAYCWIDEGFLADTEMRHELDVAGHQIAGRYLHPKCERAWRQLRQVARVYETAFEKLPRNA